MNNLDCTVLLSPSVKQKIEVNISTLVLYGIDIIENIRSITEDNIKKSNKVIILGYYNKDELSDLKLYKAVYNLEYYVITDDELFGNLVSSFAKVFLLDYSHPDTSLFTSVLYGEIDESYKIKANTIPKVEKERYLLEHTKDEDIKEICENNIRFRDILNNKLRLEKDYNSNIRRLESLIKAKEEECVSINESYSKLVSDVLELNKVLGNYNIELTRDLYTKIHVNTYKNRPKIIYIKMYEPLIYFESFITTLYQVILFQLNKSCKIVNLYDSCDVVEIKKKESLMDKMGNPVYTIIGNVYKESDVISNDRIVSYGNYNELFNILLNNDFKLDVLIVIDNKKFLDYVLEGSDILYLNACRSNRTMKTLELNPENTIVNSRGNPLSWVYYETYEDLDNRDKFQFLSNRTIMRKLYNLIKEVI